MADWLPRLKRSNAWIQRDEPPGGLDLLPFLHEQQSGMLGPETQGWIIAAFTTALEDQLQLLRTAIAAQSAVLLWAVPGNLQWYCYRCASICPQLRRGPFSWGSGILGALKGRDEVVISDYRPNSPAIPYLTSVCQVEAFYACALNESQQNEASRFALLCVDRQKSGRWTEAEQELIGTVAQLIRSSYFQARDHLLADFERRSLQQAFNGLKILNTSLDIDSVHRTTAAAIAALVRVDQVAIAMVENDRLRFAYFSNDPTEDFYDHHFPLVDSLVGQAVKYRQRFARSVTAASAPVVNGCAHFEAYGSVLVVPLLQEQEPVSAVLLVASVPADTFSAHSIDLIQMIADQVAIRIDLAQAHEQINRMTLTDALTGIANRRAFERGLAAMHERALRRDSPFSLIIGDIDLFKQINDSYGHPFGDQVIKQVAGQLGEVVRGVDLAARIGGEEFAVLLEDSDRAGAFEVAERLRTRISRLQLHCASEPVQLTISLGLVSFPGDTREAEMLLTYADRALYRAKKAGRNRSICWDSTFASS